MTTKHPLYTHTDAEAYATAVLRAQQANRRRTIWVNLSAAILAGGVVAAICLIGQCAGGI